MKLIYPTAPTRQYYQQNALTIPLSVLAQDVGPHALTQRSIYTVPAGRKAFMVGLFIWVRRATAAAPVGRYQARFNCTVGGNANIYLGRVTSTLNTVDAIMQLISGNNTLFIAGDFCKIETEDLGTGGTVDYTLTASFVEFDA